MVQFARRQRLEDGVRIKPRGCYWREYPGWLWRRIYWAKFRWALLHQDGIDRGENRLSE